VGNTERIRQQDNKDFHQVQNQSAIEIILADTGERMYYTLYRMN